MPQVCTSCGLYRNWLSGIRNSAVQAFGSCATLPSHTASHVVSQPSFDSTRSIFVPADGDVELEARALVEVAVETHADDVAGELVPAGGVLRDPGHVVVRADREVDVLVVVEDLQLGLLRRRAAFDGCLLDVVTRPLPFLPGLVVEVPVYGWRLAGERLRVVDAWGTSTAGVRGLRKRGQTQGARQCGDDASADRAAEAHGAKRLAQ